MTPTSARAKTIRVLQWTALILLFAISFVGTQLGRGVMFWTHDQEGLYRWAWPLRDQYWAIQLGFLLLALATAFFLKLRQLALGVFIGLNFLYWLLCVTIGVLELGSAHTHLFINGDLVSRPSHHPSARAKGSESPDAPKVGDHETDLNEQQ